MAENWKADECRVFMGDGGISLHNVPNGVERARPVVKLFKVLGLNVTQEFVEDAPDRRRLVRDLARRLPRPTLTGEDV